MTNISDWKVGNYVVVRYNTLWFPGKILMVHDNGSVDVTCMEYVDKFELNNKFRWHSGQDTLKRESSVEN